MTKPAKHLRRGALAATLALSAGGVAAGGLDRSGQKLDILFEKGNAASISFGTISPSVDGTYVGGMFKSGNIAKSFTRTNLAYKQQLNDQLALAFMYDEAFGADISYPASGTFAGLANTNATLAAPEVSALLHYRINERVSVFGGVRGQWLSAEVSVPGGGKLQYNGKVDKGFKTGYVVGAAYEIPDIALRVALSYNSAITHNLSTTESSIATGGATITSPDTEITMPQSVNLDFQSGIAENTLLFGRIRWVDWSETEVAPNHYSNSLGRGNLVEYPKDSVTYNLGVGRRFSDTWSGAITVGYEPKQGYEHLNLGPRDGYTSLGLGATYTRGNTKITGGVSYLWFGDTTSKGAGGYKGNFQNNTALAVGLKLVQTF